MFLAAFIDQFVVSGTVHPLKALFLMRQGIFKTFAYRDRWTS